jgi:hypothetical protein
MAHYVGLDVSLKSTAICIVDAKGKIVREGIAGPQRRELPHAFGCVPRLPAC